MLFQKLSGILAGASLSFILSEKDGVISVTVTPKSKEGSNLSNSPFSAYGTAEELDEKLADDLAAAMGQALPYLNNAEQFVKDAKAKETKATTKEKPADTSGNTATSTKVVKLTAGQNKVKKGVDGSLEKAKTEKDKDVVIFLKNQSVKLYKEAKFSDEDVKALEAAFDAIVKAGPVEAGEVKKEEKDLFSGTGGGEKGNEELTTPDQIEEDNNPELEDDPDAGSTEDNPDADDDDDIF